MLMVKMILPKNLLEEFTLEVGCALDNDFS